jgi:pilus assembly protein Flp/PilA
MDKFLSSIRSFAIEDDGAQILEYALIVAVVSLGLILAMNLTDLGFSGWIGRVSTCLTGTCAAP